MANPGGHVHHNPSHLAHPDPAWARWDRAWTRYAKTHSGRPDLTVVIAHGAGGGAPACFYPSHQRIEIDATHIGDPGIADPRRAVHRHAVAAAYGLFVHETGHAAHTRWTPPPGTPPVVAVAADLLEESRQEGRQRARRGSDRRWLRHAVQHLLLPGNYPTDDAWTAATVAALILARADARIITAKEARTARAAVLRILGKATLGELRAVWTQAHTTADDDADTMIRLGRDWCRILGIDPDTAPNPPTTEKGAFPGDLSRAAAATIATITATSPSDLLLHRHGAPASWDRRDPTTDERAAARIFGDRLRDARTRHTETTTRPSTLPPGRLRAATAITVEAQIASGATPTAAPWRRRSHSIPPKPRLILGVIVDVSGSMRPYAAPMSSAAWILAHGTHTDDASTATIAFGSQVTIVTPPRQRPSQVLDMNIGGASAAFTDAVILADHLLGLRRANTVRMLAVVSDGDLPDLDPAQQLITTLHREGCAVVWLRPDGLPGHTFTDTTTLTVTNPVEAIQIIADAALTALSNI